MYFRGASSVLFITRESDADGRSRNIVDEVKKTSPTVRGGSLGGVIE